MKIRIIAAGFILVSATTVLVNETFAQAVASKPAAADTNDITEIVVTAARKRNESAQETPIAISAIGAGELERNQITNVADIDKLVPELEIHKQLGSADSLGVFLRGFGVATNDPSIEPAIAVVVDGIYQALVNGNSLDLFDVQALEVLKGPQGTLLGKNSPSGAISITTKRPTAEFGGEAEVKYERFGRVETRGVVNLPISPVLTTKISVLSKNGGDYQKVYDSTAIVRDPATGQATLNQNGAYSRSEGGDDILAGRIGVLFTPNSDFDWYLTTDGTRNRSPQNAGLPLSTASGASVTPKGYPVTQPATLACSVYEFCTPFPHYTTAPDFRADHHVDIFDVTSNANWRAGPVVVTSLTGYKHYRGDNDGDIDGLPVDIISAVNTLLTADQFSEELRIASQKEGGLDLGGKLDWVAGLFFFDNKFTYNLPIDIFGGHDNGGLTSLDSETGHNKSYAGFLHAEYHLTDAWSATLGGRETSDKKSSLSNSYAEGTPPPAPLAASGSWNNFSFEAGTSYKIDSAKLVYFRFAEGYRGGGLQNFPTSATEAAPYKPETVKSWEVGIKSDWLEQTLRVNGSVFYNRYNDLQRAVFEAGGNGSYVGITTNAATATTKGTELEVISVPIERLTLRASAGYLDAKYGNWQSDVLGQGIVTNNSGFDFPDAPRWSGNVGADYTLLDGAPGKFALSANYHRVSSQSLNIVDFPAGHQVGYGLADLSLRFDDPSRRYNVTLYGHNIFNKYYLVNVEPVSGLALSGTEGLPATFGITAGIKF